MFSRLRSYFLLGLSLFSVDSFVVSVSVGFVVALAVWGVTLCVVFVLICLFCYSIFCLFGDFSGLLGFDRAIFVN
jgi:hypothetical protein